MLRRHEYIDSTGAVRFKGRVACEINTCDAMLLSEIIFDNVLHEATMEEAVAIIASLVFQERVMTQPDLPENLTKVGNTISIP